MSLRSEDPQTPKMPTPPRLSSSKIAPIFKGLYDTTIDPRKLPKQRPLHLRRKRVHAEPEPVYSEDEFRPEALPKHEQKVEGGKFLVTEKKMTRA